MIQHVLARFLRCRELIKPEKMRKIVPWCDVFREFYPISLMTLV